MRNALFWGKTVCACWWKVIHFRCKYQNFLPLIQHANVHFLASDRSLSDEEDYSLCHFDDPSVFSQQSCASSSHGVGGTTESISSMVCPFGLATRRSSLVDSFPVILEKEVVVKLPEKCRQGLQWTVLQQQQRQRVKLDVKQRAEWKDVVLLRLEWASKGHKWGLSRIHS